MFSFWPGEILIPDCDREFKDTSADGLIPMFLFLLLFSLIIYSLFSRFSVITVMCVITILYHYVSSWLYEYTAAMSSPSLLYLSIHYNTEYIYVHIHDTERGRERETVTHSCVWMGLRTLSMKLGRTTHMLWNESPGNSLHCLMKSPHLMANNRGFSELHQEI